MSRLVVTVDFTLKPDSMESFRALIDRNAIDSCTRESGCHRFDVMAPENGENQVFLYEIYENRAAFDAHLKTTHFEAFDRESSNLVIAKVVKFYTLMCEGSGWGGS